MGYYAGVKPTVIVADPELVKNIQIKDFNHFADRPHLSMKHGIHPNPAMSVSIIRSQGKRWKEMRSVLTPTFSASKLKTMTPIIDDAINTLIEIIDKKAESGEEFNIYDMVQGLTTDVIGRTAFGIQTNVQKDPNDKFLQAAKDVFNIKLNKWFFLVVVCLPEADLILYPFRRLEEIIKNMLGKSPTGVLLDMCKNIINLRKQNPNFRRKDLLQLMLDTKISSEELSAMSNEQLTASNEMNENMTNGVQKTTQKSTLKSTKKEFNLTDDEIKANSVIFFEAGYETTSTALGFVAHILVNYPEVQEKVREEVQELYAKEGKLDYNTVTKLQYMEWVLNETMRIYPPVTTFASREVLSDYKYNDITIPKGAQVTFPIYYLHHDPDFWQEPEKFDPMRFSPERRSQIHPSSWQPFGNGPRNCIGMRFALLEAKLALSKLLLKFRLESGPKTEIGDLALDCKLITLTPKNGVFVKAIKLS
jgi:cytochrome P450